VSPLKIKIPSKKSRQAALGREIEFWHQRVKQQLKRNGHMPHGSDFTAAQTCKWTAARVTEQSNRFRAFRRSGLIMIRVEGLHSTLRLRAPDNIESLSFVTVICPGRNFKIFPLTAREAVCRTPAFNFRELPCLSSRQSP
jgi:hypothetical protein